MSDENDNIDMTIEVDSKIATLEADIVERDKTIAGLIDERAKLQSYIARYVTTAQKPSAPMEPKSFSESYEDCLKAMMEM